jgi:hypothetical protein
MANYKEQIITGEYSEYQRAYKVIITNELNKLPVIDFMEEVIATLPSGGSVIVKRDKCDDTLSNPVETFPLLNPNDDSVIGSAEYQQIYVMLYSLYRYIANKRDVSKIPPSE